MTKTSRCFTTSVWALLCLLWAGAVFGQQENRKIIFPTPAPFTESSGFYARPVSDGGYILLGTAGNFNNFSVQQVPRMIKLDAALEVEWDNTYLQTNPQNFVVVEIQSAPLELPDGSFVFSALDSLSTIDLMRVSGTGELLWTLDLPGFFNPTNPLGVLPNGDIFATHCRFDSGLDCGVLQVDVDGNVVLFQSIAQLSNIISSAIFPNGDALTTHYVQNKIVFNRVSAQGQFLWQSEPVNNLTGIMGVAPDGSFGAVAREGTNAHRVLFFDADGLSAGQTPLLSIPINHVSAMDFYADGSFFLSGATATQRGFMARFQQDGTVLWAAESPEDGQPHLRSLGGAPTSDGWAIGAGMSTASSFGALRVEENTGIFINTISGRVGSDTDDDCALQSDEPSLHYQRIKADNGTQEFYAFSGNTGEYALYLPAGDYTLTVSSNDPFFVLCPDDLWEASFPSGESNSLALDLPMQAAELIHHISGHVRLDENGDCAPDAGDTPLNNWYVRASFSGHTAYQRTNANGFYQFFLPSGEYELSVIPFNHHFSTCAPASPSVVFSGDDPQAATVDFAISADTDCAYLRTSIGSAIVRPCLTSVIPVYYWNEGAQPGEDVAVEVTLPPGLTYLSASPAPASVSGNVLRFEPGQVLASPGGVWHRIDVTVAASCDLQIGDQVCLSAQISPAEMCGEASGWNGAVVSLSGECVGDSAIFTIKNIGSAPNSVPLEYRIVEDQIVLLQGTFQLEPDEEEMYAVFAVMADSNTYSFVAMQEPGFPGNQEVSFTLNGCVGFSSNPSGFGGDPGPFTANICIPVRNSYDPNDKQAFPLGFGEEQVIRPGTPLDYTIRFQNTGNDTAYVVVLRDTLSEHFDPARIVPIGASHPFEFAQLNNNVLHFHFPNILLPDSTTDLAGSQGYAQFRVYPKADLPLGTVVDNHAAIYFDFNPPIITNTVRRMYQEFTVVQTRDVSDDRFLAVQVFPNPFTERATFSLPDDAPDTAYRLEVYDATGRLLHTRAFTDRQCELNGGQLPSGVFFWRITAGGQVVATGKLVGK
jgi:uncharacterized repeat protein (TIGR01451 family)